MSEPLSVQRMQELATIMQLPFIRGASCPARPGLPATPTYSEMIEAGQAIDQALERIAELEDQPLRPQAETGWLLEIQIGGRAVWWRARPDCGRTWTTDANEAIRFARKVDAINTREALRHFDSFMQGAIATDHMWCPPLPEET